MTGAPSLGLVSCVKNEERFLAAFLEYHRRLGVSRAYVFLDRCTDASAEIAAAFPWVRVIPVQEHCDETFRYVAGLHRFCSALALDRAREEGLDWLMLLDPDEFAYGRFLPPWPGGTGRHRASAEEGDLRKLCAGVASDVDMIVLRTKELVPCRLGESLPFWEQAFFQSRFPLRHRVYDPMRPSVRRTVRWLGNNVGKSIVRVGADVRARGSHFWHVERDGRLQEPKTVRLGAFCHFHVTGVRHWLEKFTKLAHEPDVWAGGDRVPFTKRVWKAAAAHLDERAAWEYLERSVFRSERELCLRALMGQLSRETTVKDILSEAPSFWGP